ncbi:MAG: hypothetical protein LC725_08325 [Lentisphaerae bacterium]|nr:hypothetical protein [Lentisphaerota bacterium]
MKVRMLKSIRCWYKAAVLCTGMTVALMLFPLSACAVEAEGGDHVYEITVAGIPWRVHAFTTVGTNDFMVASGGEVEYLIVAGGGGGGNHRGNNSVGGAGGGAGGLRTGSMPIPSGVIQVVVGDGGLGG